MYQPAQYAKAFVRFYEQHREEAVNLNLTFPPLRGRDDYDGAYAELKQRREFFEKYGRELSRLEPPWFGKKEQRAHEVFSQIIKKELGLLEKAEKYLGFTSRASEFIGFFPEIGAGSGADQSTLRVRDYVNSLEKTIPNIKKSATELFKDEISDLRETPSSPPPLEKGTPPGFVVPPPSKEPPSFRDLKSGWQEAEPALDEILNYFRSLDQNTLLTELMTEAMRNIPFPVGVPRDVQFWSPRSYIAAKAPQGIKVEFYKIDAFFDKLQTFLAHNDAITLASYSSFTFVTSEEISKLESELNSLVQEF